MNRLAERLMRHPGGFQPFVDFIARDDGDRGDAYIEEWLSEKPRPSDEELLAIVLSDDPVPQILSKRQFAQVLALDGVISQDEALAWAAQGILPDDLENALGLVPEGEQRFGARILLASASEFQRSHPLVGLLGAVLMNPATHTPYDALALDGIWIRGGAL